MATTLYLTSVDADMCGENGGAALAGGASGWLTAMLSTNRGDGVNAFSGQSTVVGPTVGIEVGGSTTRGDWISPPLDADVTISGSITWNLWASENNMSANVAINGQLEVVDGATGAVTLIDKTTRTTEVAVATRAVNNFSETPAAGIACKRGDRLRVRIFADDSTADMNSGFSWDFSYDSSSPGADGDSFITLTEDLTFMAEPAGTTIYLTDTASPVSTASVDREAWTSRGAGVQTDVTNTTSGWTAPIQVTDTAGGTVVDWFTRPLTTFTLGGAVRCNLRGLESSSSANAVLAAEVARVDGDGTNAVAWAKGTWPSGAVTTELGTSQVVESFLIAGDDLAVSDGQRLRIRIFIDDAARPAPMSAGFTVTTHYAGTSDGASGDTFLTFAQTLTEFIASVPYRSGYPQLLAH